jgi:hypothetical protein
LNLTSKKARVPIIAVGTAALVAGGGLLASTAFGAGALTLNPTTTSVTVPNIGQAKSATDAAGHFNLVQALSNAAYGVRVTTTLTNSLKLQVESYTAPSPSSTAANPFLYYAEKTPGAATGPAPIATDTAGGGNGTPDDGPWIQLDADNATPPSATLTGSSSVATKDVFLVADVPGTYKFHFVDPGVNIGTDDDLQSDTITMTVKDASANTAETTDDWLPAVSNSTSSAGIGAPITASVSLSTTTTADVRGSSSGTGILGSAINTLLGIKATGAGLAGGITTSTAGTLSGSTTTRSIATGATGSAGTLTTTAAWDKNGDGTLTDTTLGTATTSVTDNNVDTVTVAAKEVTGSVEQTGTNVAVKTGTAAVTYEATVTSTPAADIASKVVYFTVNGSAPNLAKLSTSGTAVDVTSTTSKIYSAVTNADGVASFTVTSSDPDAADSYQIDADSNGNDNIGGDLTATYADAGPTTFTVVNETAELFPEVGTTSVVIKGKLSDQFGAAYQPPSSSTQQVQVGIDVADPNSVWDTDVVSGLSTPIASDGTFSFTYTPSPAATSGQVDVVRFRYTGATTLDTTLIQWASTATPATVTLTTPTDEATGVNLSDFDTIDPGQSNATTGSTGGADADDFGNANGQVSGTVLDGSNATIAYKKVTITGTSGVYFSTATGGTELKPSIDVVTNASGVFNGVYAFFTKPGDAKITATAGTATKDADVTTDDSADAFKVIAIDASGEPGATLVVTGKVTDFFGHPVPNTQVNLSTGSSTIGSLSDTTPNTNDEGVWSTTFISGSNQSGEVTLVATLNGQTTNKTPDTDWTSESGAALTGLPENGEYRDEATITIQEDMVTLEATAVVVGGGRAFVSGTAKPNSNVDVYIKPVGADTFTLYDVVKADEEGEFGTSKNIARSTQWLARQGSISSTVELSSVQSTVTIGTRALGGGRAVLAGDGKPNAKTTLRFYRVLDNGDLVKIKTVSTNSAGYGSFIWKTSKGAKKVRVYYTAPGTRGAFAEKVVVVK